MYAPSIVAQGLDLHDTRARSPAGNKLTYIRIAIIWARGAMDNASDYGSEDSRFESWRARAFVQLNIFQEYSRKLASLLGYIL